MNILLVEDEGITALFLKECLSSLQHQVLDCFVQAQKLYAFLQQNHQDVDAIFLDILIKGDEDGTKIAQEVRQLYPHIILVFITAYKDSDTIKKASLSKPNGYLIKPVQKEDIEALLMVLNASKQTVENSKIIHFGVNYTYDKSKNLFYAGQITINLTSNELKCLRTLVQNKGSCVSIGQLQQSIWNNNEDRVASLRELLYRIRRKFPKVELKNIPNVGYVLH